MESPSHKTQPSSTRQRSGPVFDYERSLARLGGDPLLFNEIVLLFLEDSPQLAERARQALEEKNLPELERAAHSLKGLSVNFEARAMASAALSVEQHARDGDLERAAASFPDLQSKLERLQTELTEFHQAHSQAPHSQAQHSQAQHSQAQHSQAQHSQAQHSQAQHSQAQHSQAQHSQAQHGQAPHSQAHTRDDGGTLGGTGATPPTA